RLGGRSAASRQRAPPRGRRSLAYQAASFSRLGPFATNGGRRLREPSPRRPPCRRHTWILATCESRRDLGIVALHPGHPIDRRVAVIRPYNVRLLALAVAAPAVQLRQLLREHTRLPRLHRGMRPIGTPPRLSGI